jgi:hypothetical protein
MLCTYSQGVVPFDGLGSDEVDRLSIDVVRTYPEAKFMVIETARSPSICVRVTRKSIMNVQNRRAVRVLVAQVRPVFCKCKRVCTSQESCCGMVCKIVMAQCD